MTISAKIIVDSVSPQGIRLTTMQITLHRYVLAEFNTHRMFSRNFRSSRAVPVAKLLHEVHTNPAMPIHWGKNQPGMQAHEDLHPDAREEGMAAWKRASGMAADMAEHMAQYGVHKQVANRVIEPYLYVHGIVTATDYANFYALRRHPDAQPEMKALADAMWDAQQASKPTLLQPGQWHLPYVEGFDLEALAQGLTTSETLKKVSVARVARVSYNNHDGSAPDIVKDIDLHDSLLSAGHMSPFEHQATPDAFQIGHDSFDRTWLHPEQHGNLVGWCQYRKSLPNEWVPG